MEALLHLLNDDDYQQEMYIKQRLLTDRQQAHLKDIEESKAALRLAQEYALSQMELNRSI